MSDLQCQHCREWFDRDDSLASYRASTGEPLVLCINCGRYTPALAETNQQSEENHDQKPRQLTLIEEADRWTARDETDQITAHGRTRAEAIRKLLDVIGADDEEG
jgi:adenine-specific DNA methylase